MPISASVLCRPLDYADRCSKNKPWRGDHGDGGGITNSVEGATSGYSAVLSSSRMPTVYGRDGPCSFSGVRTGRADVLTTAGVGRCRPTPDWGAERFVSRNRTFAPISERECECCSRDRLACSKATNDKIEQPISACLSCFPWFDAPEEPQQKQYVLGISTRRKITRRFAGA